MALASVITPSLKEQLKVLLQTLALKRGHFVLASGKTSDYYLDCRQVNLDAQGAAVVGQALYQLISNTFAAQPIDSVGGVVLGAAPMVTAISTASIQAGNPLSGFLIRKAAKGYGQSKQIEGHVQPWHRVVLVEDVVTSGGSLIRGVEALQREYPNVTLAGVISLVDRQAGGREKIEALGIPYINVFDVSELLK